MGGAGADLLVGRRYQLLVQGVVISGLFVCVEELQGNETRHRYNNENPNYGASMHMLETQDFEVV